MQFDQLRYFLELARVGNVGRAASRLGIGQPTLSRSMKLLEDGLDLKLFDRHGRGVMLTPEGFLFLEKVEAALRSLDQPLRSHTDPERLEGTVTVGFSPSSASALAAPLAKAILGSHPGIRLTMLEATGQELERTTRARRIDASVLHESTEVEEFSITPIMRERFCLVLPSSSDMAHVSSAMHFRGLTDVPLVLLSPKDATRRLMLRAEKQHGIRLSPVAEGGSTTPLESMVRSNVGCGVASRRSVQDEISRGSLLVRSIAVLHWFRNFRR